MLPRNTGSTSKTISGISFTSQDEFRARYELCEDLAQALMERAQMLQFDLGVTEADVLQQPRVGPLDELRTDDAGVGPVQLLDEQPDRRVVVLVTGTNDSEN